MFKLEPCVVAVKIAALAHGQHPSAWQQGVGAATRVGDTQFLYQKQNDPWVGFVDLAGTPLPDRFVTLLVNWFKNLRPALAARVLYLSRPRVSGYRLVVDFQSFDTIPQEWPTNHSPVSFLVPHWRSLGGESQIRFRDVKQLDRIRLNHRDQNYRICARSFSGENALLLARLSQEDEYQEVYKGLNHDQRLFFESSLKKAKEQFINDLVGNFNLADTFPGIAHLLMQQENSSDRLKLFAEWSTTAFDVARVRPIYARS